MSLVVLTALRVRAVGASLSWVPEAEHPVSTIATTSVHNASPHRARAQGLSETTP